MNLAGTAIHSQEKNVLEIKRRNENLLLLSGPGGAESEISWQVFTLKQAAEMRELDNSMGNTAVDAGANLNVLYDTVDVIEG